MTDRTRADWPRAAALAVLTAIGVYLCYLIVFPFLPGVTWAVALAVMGLPLHRWVSRRVTNPSWAAGVSTAAVVLAIAVPVLATAGQFAVETKRVAGEVKAQTEGGKWREWASRVPSVGPALAGIDLSDVQAEVRDAARALAVRSYGVVQGAAGATVQALVAVFVLFYCFRDRGRLLSAVRKLIPLDHAAADRVLSRADDAVHATVYGTFLTSVIQAVTGGLLFWALGVPGAVLWTAVMIVLGVLPFVGVFLVWGPVAVWLATEERWGAAAVVVVWGVVFTAVLGNYLYALWAGDRLKMHPVPTLVAFIGGLAVFGASGLVLGPCVLAVTAALLDVWRHRAADGIPVAAHTTGTGPKEREGELPHEGTWGGSD